MHGGTCGQPPSAQRALTCDCTWVHLLWMQEAREGKFITGDHLTHGDLAVFCQLGWLQSGWMKGER
jgi:glutathione S-transferase